MAIRNFHQLITNTSLFSRRRSLAATSFLALGLSMGACAEAPDSMLGTGGAAAGGAAAGGAAAGGAAAGGAAAGGATSGGASAGGASSGGASSGGSGTGGETPAGGSASGGAGSGGGDAVGGGSSGGAGSGGGPSGPEFSEIAEILTMRCATAMCHGKTPPTGGISLKNDAALHGTLTGNTMIAECGNAKLVVAGDAEASAIVKLLVGTECMKNGMVLKMPPMGAAIPAGDLDKIKAWIDAGAAM